MKRIDLPHGHQTIVDDVDASIVDELTLYRGANGYVYYSKWEDGRSVPRTLHALLVQPVKGMHVDHINGDSLDNRRSNLRVVSHQINQVNRSRPNKNNTSGIRGVAYRPHLSKRRPWHAQIMAARKAYHLGMFATREEAIEARRAAELEHYGEACP